MAGFRWGLWCQSKDDFEKAGNDLPNTLLHYSQLDRVYSEKPKGFLCDDLVVSYRENTPPPSDEGNWYNNGMLQAYLGIFQRQLGKMRFTHFHFTATSYDDAMELDGKPVVITIETKPIAETSEREEIKKAIGPSLLVILGHGPHIPKRFKIDKQIQLHFTSPNTRSGSSFSSEHVVYIS